jgi:hypothetical protein
MHLGGTTIPDSIASRGRYLYQKEVLRTNGDGEAVVSGYATVTWTFDFMEMTDINWIATTLMGGAYSLKFTSAQLKNDLGVLTTFTNAVSQRPTYEYASNGSVEGVTWKIERVR